MSSKKNGRRGAGSSDVPAQEPQAQTPAPSAATAEPDAPPADLPLWACALVAAAYMALGLAFAFTAPFNDPVRQDWTPPDEPAHMLYVNDLVEARRIPIFTSGSGNYEAHQPPLYYTLCVPAFLIGRASGDTAPEQARGALMACRLFTLLIGLGVIALAALVARELLPGRPAAQLGTIALVGLLPSHVSVLASVSNDPLAELLSLLVIWLSLRTYRQRGEMDQTAALKRAALLGALVGVAVWAKMSLLFLAIVPLLALGLKREGDAALAPQDWLKRYAICGGVALAVISPWLWRNHQLYGDPLAAKVFVEVFGRDRATPDYFTDKLGMSGAAYYQLVLLQTFLSFWGVLGQANVYLPSWCYLLGVVLAVGTLGGGVARLIRGPPWDRPGRGRWTICLTAVVFVLAFFLRFNAEFYQAQARYLFPVLAPIVALIAAGWSHLALLWPAEGQRRRVAWALVGIVVACAAVLAVAGLAVNWPGAARLDPPLGSG